MERLPRGSGASAELMGGARFELDLSEWPQAQAFLLGRYAPELVRFVVAHLREGSVFVDVGAHVGLVALQVGALTHPNRVAIHAFEPHPDAARRFRLNQRLNPQIGVRLNEYALTDRAGNLVLNLRTHAVESAGANAPHAAEVPAMALDDYLEAAGVGYADVVKIDVEGHELAVLRGATRALAEGRIGHVVVEMLAAHYARLGTSPLDVVAFMSRHGYAPRPLPRARPSRLRRSRTGARGGGDVVFAPNSLPPTVTAPLP